MSTFGYMEQLIPELKFSFSRSGGAGGQHVNKVSTKVTLHFDLMNSNYLTDQQKATINEKLSQYINQEGILQLSAQHTRSQLRNKEAVIVRFCNLIQTALTPQKARKATRVPRHIKAKRLRAKRLQSQKKANRRVDDWE